MGQYEFVFRVRKRSAEGLKRADERQAMRVSIAGAGAIGRSVALELLAYGHKVLLIENHVGNFEPLTVPDADWLLADACELRSLEEAGMERCDVVIAATGDDKVNLTTSLLSKTEFGVSRVVARVNDARNEWLFNEAWGVDVAVSTPRVLAALVEEAVSVGDLVRLMTFRQGEANLVELTLAPDAPHVGHALREVVLPRDAALVAILRGGRVIVPTPDDPLEAGDELLFVASQDVEAEIRNLLSSPQH
jgi:trk system potassium uptake protein